jgi:hypothetical protein
MKKEHLFPLIIFLAFIIDLVTGRLLYNAYINQGLITTDAGYSSYVTTSMFLTFVFSTAYYVIILLFFREQRLLSIYSALAIVVGFAFAGYVSLTNYFELNTIIVRVYGSVSYFIAFANIILATSIVLKEIHTKLVALSLIYFSIIQFVFGTLVTDYVRGYLVGVFGPYESNIQTLYIVYDIIVILLRLSVVILQVLSIRSLLRVQQGHIRVLRRM